MEITITARHCTVPESIREQTSRLIQRMDRFEPRTVSAAVLFEVENTDRIVEARVKVAKGPPLVARASGPTFRPALRRRVLLLARQLKRHRMRRIARRMAAGRTPVGIEANASEE
jgi:ribosomal subunit interface protein